MQDENATPAADAAGCEPCACGHPVRAKCGRPITPALFAAERERDLLAETARRLTIQRDWEATRAAELGKLERAYYERLLQVEHERDLLAEDRADLRQMLQESGHICDLLAETAQRLTAERDEAREQWRRNFAYAEQNEAKAIRVDDLTAALRRIVGAYNHGPRLANAIAAARDLIGEGQ